MYMGHIGWQIETAIYSRAIKALFKEMRRLLGDAKVENSHIIFYYFLGRWAHDIEYLTSSSLSKIRTMTDSPLDELIRSRMVKKEERLEQSLTRLFYDIDGPEYLSLVCDPGRLEKV